MMGQDVCPVKPEPTLSFTQGLIVGQISVVLLLAAFIKFFIFVAPEPANVQRTTRLPTPTLNKKKSSILRQSQPTLTIGSILNKTYYKVDSHQPESLDWFNVLVAQAIAQLRSDAQHDDAILSSLTKAMNGTSRPDFVDEIRVTELTLGEDFPIFSNCRIIPVDENGLDFGPGKAFDANMATRDGTRLQARMDVDLSDMITLALETQLLLNYPKKLSAVLPVALAVSVVRFSGTLSISFIPSNSSENTPTKMVFTFLDDYRLDLSVRSLLGSRSRLQDVPKIAQLVESRLHQWFDDRCVEPRFQEIALPSMWPRKKNTRGGDEAIADAIADAERSMSSAREADIAKNLREEARKEIEAEEDTRGHDTLRYRRRPRADSVYSIMSAMPGSIPDVHVDVPT